MYTRKRNSRDNVPKKRIILHRILVKSINVKLNMRATNANKNQKEKKILQYFAFYAFQK